jgi:hypothetical protein
MGYGFSRGLWYASGGQRITRVASRSSQPETESNRRTVMTVRKMAIAFVLSIVAGIVVGGILMGLVGLLVAGPEGVANGVIWGVLLGALGGVGAAGYIGYEGWSAFMRQMGDLFFRRR